MHINGIQELFLIKKTYCLKSLLASILAMNCAALIYFPSRDQCDKEIKVV